MRGLRRGMTQQLRNPQGPLTVVGRATRFGCDYLTRRPVGAGSDGSARTRHKRGMTLGVRKWVDATSVRTTEPRSWTQLAPTADRRARDGLRVTAVSAFSAAP